MGWFKDKQGWLRISKALRSYKEQQTLTGLNQVQDYCDNLAAVKAQGNQCICSTEIWKAIDPFVRQLGSCNVFGDRSMR